jgi:hypothetical protein
LQTKTMAIDSVTGMTVSGVPDMTITTGMSGVPYITITTSGDPMLTRNPSTCHRQRTMSRDNRLASASFFHLIFADRRCSLSKSKARCRQPVLALMDTRALNACKALDIAPLFGLEEALAHVVGLASTHFFSTVAARAHLLCVPAAGEVL